MCGHPKIYVSTTPRWDGWILLKTPRVLVPGALLLLRAEVGHEIRAEVEQEGPRAADITPEGAEGLNTSTVM